MKRLTPKRKPALTYQKRGGVYRPQPTIHRSPVVSKQAQHIVNLFGGPAVLAFALNQLPDPQYHRGRVQIYKWGYSRAAGGTGGYIPSSMHQGIVQAARLMGIIITDKDWRHT